MKQLYKKYVNYFEAGLAVVVLVALLFYSYNSLLNMLNLDWSLDATFYSFISTILLILVGLELIRLMVFHSFTTVLELMILIIARKLLAPEIDALSILLSVLAMAVVIGLNYLYALKPIKSLEDLSR